MFLPLYLVGGMAAGDVKLLGVVGCFLGPWGAVIAGLATMMAGAVFGIIAIAWRRFRPEFNLHATQMPNSPDGETHGSADLVLLRSQQRFTHIAYAPAITAGTIAALWYIDFLPERFLG
jgi:prepilin peptidase CpaA